MASSCVSAKQNGIVCACRGCGTSCDGRGIGCASACVDPVTWSANAFANVNASASSNGIVSAGVSTGIAIGVESVSVTDYECGSSLTSP